MACYTIDFNGYRFNVSSSNVEGETSLQNLLNALMNLKEQNIDDFLAFQNLLVRSKDNGRSVDARHNKNIPYNIQRNLKKLGVEMRVLNDLDWQVFCEEQSRGKEVGLNPNSKSFFYNGVIYVRQNGFEVTDTLHELSHFMLAVMRGMGTEEDPNAGFKKYRNFIKTLYQHPEVLKIAWDLQKEAIYSEDSEMDFEEEAVVHYLEGVFQEESDFVPTFLYNGQEIDLIDFLNDGFQEIIEDVFGVENYPGIVTMFKSLVGDVGNFGSTLFELPEVPSIGYKKAKESAVKAQLISALINYYLSPEGGKLITQTCL